MKNALITLENLVLYPLNSEELSLWLNDIPSLEEKLGCSYSIYPISDILKKFIYSQLILGLSESQDKWIWYTYWFIIRKFDNKMIGTLSFKGKPDINNEVEIAYALNNEHKHKGYMTEALTGLCDWLKQKSLVSSIKAETKLDNYPSQNLLKRCCFKLYMKTDFSLIFKLNLVNNGK